MHAKLKFEKPLPLSILTGNQETRYYHYKWGVQVIVFKGLLVYTYTDREINTWLGELA